jgi:hypothetical protein
MSPRQNHNFAYFAGKGLRELGQKHLQNILMFADTKAEWMIAAQVPPTSTGTYPTLLAMLRTGAESRGAEFKLPPPRAGAEITNCGSGFRSTSGSFLFIEDVNKFYKKIMVAKEFFLKYYNFNPILGTTCINPCNKVLVLKSKRVIVKVSYKMFSKPGVKPEPKINIFGSATLLTSCLPAWPTLPADLPTQFPSLFGCAFWEGKK